MCRCRLATPETWDHFADVLVDVAGVLKRHGHSFQEVMNSNVMSAVFYLVRNKHRDSQAA